MKVLYNERGAGQVFKSIENGFSYIFISNYFEKETVVNIKKGERVIKKMALVFI